MKKNFHYNFFYLQIEFEISYIFAILLIFFFPYYCFFSICRYYCWNDVFFSLYSYYGNILVQNVIDYFYAMSFIPFVRSLSFCLCYFLGYCDFLSATSINNPEMANCSWRCCYFSLFIRIIPERSLSSVITNSNVKISENVEKIW